MIDYTPYRLALNLVSSMLVMLDRVEGTKEVDLDVRRMRDVRSETTCSKFTGSYAPVYYCWLVDPCVEDLLEAPRFLYSQACTTDCEVLPSEYETCQEWKLDDGMQSCETYGPLPGCCRHRTCTEGQECVDLVPGASFCRVSQPPPSPDPPSTPISTTPELTTVPTSPLSTTTVGATPRETVMPPPVSTSSPPAVNTTSSSPTVNTTSSVVKHPPQPGGSSLSSVNTTATPSSGLTTDPSTVPSTTSTPSQSTPSLPIPPAVPQPVSTFPQTPSSTAEAVTQVSTSTTMSTNQSGGEMHPSWITAGIIVLLSAVVIICLTLFLERRNDNDDESKRDDEMAIDETYWTAITQKSHGNPVLQRHPLNDISRHMPNNDAVQVSREALPFY